MVKNNKWHFWEVFSVGIILIGTPIWAMALSEEARVESFQDQVGKENTLLDRWGLGLSALVEVEAAYTDDEREAGDNSDIALSTVEIGVDFAPMKRVSAHLLFLFEEDDTDPIEVDEGYIRLNGEEKIPFYLCLGRQYLPFGRFESYFISDPITLELGETRESSIVASYGSELLEIILSVFNGGVRESDQRDDHINGYSASVVFTPKFSGKLQIVAGWSYISNIGDSDGLQGEDGIDVDDGGTIASPVAGVAAFVSAHLMEKLFLELEYVSALDEFSAGELAFDGGESARPSSYNVELNYQITDLWAAGIRFAGARESGDFLPKVQYGAMVTCELRDGVSVGLEYQYNVFDTPDDEQMNTLTTQLSFAF